MTTKKVLYIHGFNSGRGKKVTALENENFIVFCPQLQNKIEEDIKVLKNIVKKENIKTAVGTSLGGYFGLILAQNFKDVNFYLINPSYKPYITLQRFLGQTIQNYKTGKPFTVEQNFLEALKNNAPNLNEINLENCNFYFGTNDEVLNFEELQTDLKATKQKLTIFTENQDHRYQDISLIIEHIKTNLDNESI